MAITRVRIQIDGVWTTASKNSDGKWVCNLVAPDTTSKNMAGGYYPITAEITNDAGTVSTFNASSVDIGTSLRLIVKEIIKPIITLVSPTAGTLTVNNKLPVTFKVTDEVKGSGVDLATVALTLDGVVYKQGSAGMAFSSITNGYQFTYTPQTAMKDGTHTIKITASDRDGNAAAAVSASYTLDTTKPQLTVSSPANGLITNKPALILRGATNDTGDSPVTVTVTLNGAGVGAITISQDGTFAKELTLKEGSNTIVVTSRDAAGNFTSITRTVKLDTSVPKLSKISISPNPANASASIQIVMDIT